MRLEEHPVLDFDRGEEVVFTITVSPSPALPTKPSPPPCMRLASAHWDTVPICTVQEVFFVPSATVPLVS